LSWPASRSRVSIVFHGDFGQRHRALLLVDVVIDLVELREKVSMVL